MDFDLANEEADPVEEAAVHSLDPRHPVVRVIMVLRLWLGVVCGVMFVNGSAAKGYLLANGAVSIPFYLLALVAAVWIVFAWNIHAIIWCSAILTVGTLLRGFEIGVYAEEYTVQQRLVGLSLWWFIACTFLAVGIVNLVAASRQRVERWVIHGGDLDRDSR